VIVEVFVAQGQREDALREHRLQQMLDAVCSALVGEAAREASEQVDFALGFAQQQRAAVAGNLAARETRLHATRKMCFKCERFLVTLCHG